MRIEAKDAFPGVQSARVGPNLETATYNNDPRPAATQIRRDQALGTGVYLEITSVYLRMHLPAMASPSNLTAHQFVISALGLRRGPASAKCAPRLAYLISLTHARMRIISGLFIERW